MFFDLSQRLASVVHQSITELLPSVHDLNRWMSYVSKIQIAAGQRPHWYTPNKMRVESYSENAKTEQFSLVVAGKRLNIRCDDAIKGSINPRRSTSSVTPDYIHSMDAAFAEQFIMEWSESMLPIVTVHDCFGTSLEHVGRMRKRLNQRFNSFYLRDYLERHRLYVKKSTGKKVKCAPYASNQLDPKTVGSNWYLFT